MDFSSSSDSERDDSLAEDLEALRRACILTGADPETAAAGVSSSVAVAREESFDSSDDDDDVALLRHLRERFRSSQSPSSSSPPFVTPLCTWPPSDSEDEDDLETLRAIQRRFSHYETGTSTMSPKFEKTEASDEVNIESLSLEAHREKIEVIRANTKALTRSMFPKSAQLLVDALKKNRSCQKLIRKKMIEIEAKIEENKELKDRVKCLMDFQVGCKRTLGIILCQKEDSRVRLISIRKQRTVQAGKTAHGKKSALCLGPAENPQVSKYKMVLKQFPTSLQKRPWSDAEKEKLAKGIKQQYQEMMILNSMNNESDLDDLNAVDTTSALSNGYFEITPESLRSFLPSVNWDKVASMFLPGRSGAECESRWLNCEDPLINNNPWTVQEEKKLLFTVQERGIYNWINIAVTLGTNRTPFQCLSRYQRSLNPHILNKDWTKEEDIKLQAAVETFGEDWQLVSASLEGRTGPQCSNRWRKSLDPRRKKVGRWSVDEDKRLKVAVMLFGAKNWNKIAQFIPGRTQVQCRERWLNCLDPSLNLQPWTAEEDSKLLAAISEHGYCWSKIASCIPPRTDNQCRRRWMVLLPHEVPLLQAARKMKRAVLISNFVDRESERPGIGPSDFVSLVHTESDGNGLNTLSDKVKKPRAKSRRSRKKNSSVDDPMKSGACINSDGSAAIHGSAVAGITVGKSRKRSSGTKRLRGSIKPMEENLGAPENVISSSGDVAPASHIGSSHTGDDVCVKRKRKRASSTKRLRGSIKPMEESLGAPDNVISSSGDVAPASHIGSSHSGDVCVKRKRKRASSTKRLRGSIRPMEENLGAPDNVISSSGDVAPAPHIGNSHSGGDVCVKRKRKRASRDKGKQTEGTKSVADNSAPDGVVNVYSADLDSPGMLPPDGRAPDVKNMCNKRRRKSTSRSKQTSTPADTGSMDNPNNGSSIRSKRKSNSRCIKKVVSVRRSIKARVNSVGSSGENPAASFMMMTSAGPEPVASTGVSTAVNYVAEGGSTGRTEENV